MGLRLLPYARISREDNSNVENTAIQLMIIREWAAREGHTIVAEFVDDNKSAYSDAYRPNYERLLDSVRANQGDAIAVTEEARLNRRLRASLEVFQLAYSTDLKYIMTPEGIARDLSSLDGILQAIGAAGEAEKESRNTSRRQKNKKHVQAAAGKYNGGRRQYGYDKHHLELVPHEAANGRDAVQRRLDGESLTSIVADWNTREPPIKTALGGKWTVTTLRTWMMSPAIAGLRVHLGILYKAEWPAIIERDKWEHLQIVLAGMPGKGLVQARRYLLSGILVCGRCSSPMIGRRWHDPRRGLVIPRYFCKGCGRVYRMAEPIEALVTLAVLRRLDSPQFVQALSVQCNDEELRAKIGERQNMFDHKKELLDEHARRILNAQEYEYARRVVEEEIAEVERQISTMQHGKMFASLPLDGTLPEVWQDADMDFQRDLIRLLIKRIVVLPGRGPIALTTRIEWAV